jgi:methylamine--corrinoid protein Co-methyltransferase
VAEDKFDRQLFFPKVQALVKKYELIPDLNNPVCLDDALAEAVFQAGVDLISGVGVYCTDSNRIIELSRAEVEEAIREAPGSCWMGEGKDRRYYPVRKPDDFNTPAMCAVGGSLPCSTEEIAFKTVEGLARIHEADCITQPSIMHLNNIPIVAGSPQGFLACIRGVEIGRAACRQAGRPGLAFVNGIPGAGSAIETIAASFPAFGLRKTDGWYVGFTAEMKINYGALTKCALLERVGGHIGSEQAPIIGGYCGGPAGAAIANVAYIIAGIMVMRGHYALCFPVDMHLGVTGTRSVLWATSVSSQAISRHINYPFHHVAYPNGGPMTKSYFYEVAAHHLTAITSGSCAQTGLPAKGTQTDHMTPMEFKMAAKIIKSAHTVSRTEANKIVNKIIPEYEESLATPDIGKSYQEVFDLDTGLPTPEYVEFYTQIKKELRDLGIPLDT